MPPVYAQTPLNPFSSLGMPLPGVMIEPTQVFAPALMRAVRVFPDEPLRFDFVMEKGEAPLKGEALSDEYAKMIKYFLAAMTIPDDEMWVNLSPLENEPIIPQAFGRTEMGRDLLAQDYVLKQLTASLLYPEKGIGKKFWNQVRAKVKEKYGDIDIPMETFHKVWVVPDEAEVTVQNNTAFVTKSRLRVMIEEDYVLMGSHLGAPDPQSPSAPAEILSGEPGNRGTGEQIKEIIREIILPEIEKEVNEGKHFATLRQVYHALILATWFKRNLQKSFLGKVYVDQDKIPGVDAADKMVKYKIYQQYMNAFKQGVFDFIKEEYDESTGAVVPRQYFSGGVKFAQRVKEVYKEREGGPDGAMLTHLQHTADIVVTDLAVSDRRPAEKDGEGDRDAAMLTTEGAVYYVPRLFFEGINDEGHALSPLDALERALAIWLQGGDEVDEDAALANFSADIGLRVTASRSNPEMLVFLLDSGDEVPLVYADEWLKKSHWLLTDPQSQSVKAIVRWAVALRKRQLHDRRAEQIDMEQASKISVFFTELERFLENRQTILGRLTPEEKRLLGQIEIVRMAEYRNGGDTVYAPRTDIDIYAPTQGDKGRELLWSYRLSEEADKNFIRNDQRFGFYWIPGGDMKVLVRTPDGTFLIQALGYQSMPDSFDKEWIDFRVRVLDDKQADALVKVIPFWPDQTVLTPETFVEDVGAHLDILKPSDQYLFRRMTLVILKWLIRDPVLNRYKDVVKAGLSKDAFTLSDDGKYFVVKTRRGQEVPLFKITDRADQPLEIVVSNDFSKNSTLLMEWVNGLRTEMLRRQIPRHRQMMALPVAGSSKPAERKAVSRFLWHLGIFLDAGETAGALNQWGLDLKDKLEIRHHTSRFFGETRTRDGKMVDAGKADYGDISVYLKGAGKDSLPLVFQHFSNPQQGLGTVAYHDQFAIYRLLNSSTDALILRFADRVFLVEAKGITSGSDWPDHGKNEVHEFEISPMNEEDLNRLINSRGGELGDAAMLAGREIVIDKTTGAQLIKPANPEELKQWQEKFRQLKDEFAVWWSGGDLEKFMRVFFEKLVFDFGKFLTQHKFTNLKGQNDLFKNIFGHDELAELVRHVLEKIYEDPEAMMEILGNLDERDHQGALPDGEDDDDVLSLLNYLKTTTETPVQQMERVYLVMRFMFANNMDSLVDFLYQFGYAEREGTQEAVLKEWEEVRQRTGRASQYVLMNMFPHTIGFRMYRGTSKIEANGAAARFVRPAYFSLFREGPEGTYQKKTGQLLVADVPLESVRMFHPIWMVDKRSADYGEVLVSAGEYALVDDTGENADLERGDRLTISVKDMILGMLKSEDQTAVMKIDDLRLSFSDAETLEKQVFYLRIILTELLSNARERGLRHISLSRTAEGGLLFRIVNQGEIDFDGLLKMAHDALEAGDLFKNDVGGFLVLGKIQAQELGLEPVTAAEFEEQFLQSPSGLGNLLWVGGLGLKKKADETSGFGSAMIRGFAQLLDGEYEIHSSQGETVAEVSIPSSDEFQIVDAAMMTNVDAAASTEIDGKTARKVGGIDLDPRKMDLRARGEQVEFAIPAAFEGVDPNMIPGFTPLILNIVPATDLPMFFGNAAGQRVAEDG